MKSLIMKVRAFGALVAAMAVVVPSAASASQFVLFDTKELVSKNITLIPQWASALRRIAGEPMTWANAFDTLHDAQELDRIRIVNDAINRVAYVEDIDNWGIADYWSTPAEFLARGGDCEDYAITKYLALRHLGLPASAMRIVVLYDQRRERAHAVLAVNTDQDVVILDNQIDDAVSAAEIAHYAPFYSINEQAWWLH